MGIKCVAESGNSKIGVMSTTYRRVGETCPSTCSHLVSKSCYALSSFTGIHQRLSDRSEFDGMIYNDFISSLSEKTLKKTKGIVRIHTAGDFFYQDKIDAMYVHGVKTAHLLNPHILGYTYTHRFRDFGAYDWPENLVVNASCDSLLDLVDAAALGWPTVTTVAHDDTRRRWEQDGFTFVTCPAQTAGITCAQCRLCMKKDRPFVVAFRGHGSSKKKVVSV